MIRLHPRSTKRCALSHSPRRPGVFGASLLARHRSGGTTSGHATYGRHYAALARLGAAARGDLESAEAWLELGRGALMRGEIGDATEYLLHAVLLGTPHPDAPALVAHVLAHGGPPSAVDRVSDRRNTGARGDGELS